jgi:hypothetical protein
LKNQPVKGNTIPVQAKTPISISIQLEKAGLRFKLSSAEQLFPWNASQSTLKKWLADQSIQVRSIQHVSIELITELFLLLPFEFDSPLYRNGFIQKALGENALDGHEVHEQTADFAQANLLFLIPSVWKDFLSLLFPLAQLHYSHLIGNELAKTKAYIYPRIQLHLFDKSALVILIQQGKLHLANVFPYESPTELAFYLHSIREAFTIQWSEETIQLRGPEKTNTKLIQSLIELDIPLEPRNDA